MNPSPFDSRSSLPSKPAWGHRPHRSLLSPLLGISFLLVCLILFVFWINSAPATSETLILSVSHGTPAYRVAHFLETQGQIRSRFWFLLMARARGATTKIHAGNYEIQAGRSASSILSDLISGRTLKTRVTIPEGFASWQIAAELERQRVCSGAEFLSAIGRAADAVPEQSLEGFLFPETYYFEEHTPAIVIKDQMTKNFDRIWRKLIDESVSEGAVVEVIASSSPIGPEKVRLSDGRVFSRKEIVTLASLVEREARKPEERALISAVYHNRLKKRMPLEADPTIQFALGFWKERIIYKDLEVSSPYNTYRHRGLPPGPICSPGEDALRAALSPARVDYLYFVADVSGGHHFSSSFKEHSGKVRQWNAERRLIRIQQNRQKNRKD